MKALNPLENNLLGIKRFLGLFLATLLLSFSSLCSAQISLLGTSWVGVDGTGQTKYEITFLGGGVFQYSHYDKDGNKIPMGTFQYTVDQQGNKVRSGVTRDVVATGNWTQSGANIYMETNNKYAERRGVVDGSSMHGKAVNIKGDSWVWTYKLIKPLNSDKKEGQMGM